MVLCAVKVPSRGWKQLEAYIAQFEYGMRGLVWSWDLGVLSIHKGQSTTTWSSEPACDLTQLQPQDRFVIVQYWTKLYCPVGWQYNMMFSSKSILVILRYLDRQFNQLKVPFVGEGWVCLILVFSEKPPTSCMSSGKYLFYSHIHILTTYPVRCNVCHHFILLSTASSQFKKNTTIDKLLVCTTQ